MATKASKKSRSSYSSYSHAAKSAKTSHRYGSLSLSFSHGATDDHYDAASASALHSAEEEPVIIAIPAPAEGSTIPPSAVADHDDDNDAASSTSDAHEAVSTIMTVSTAVPQSQSTTELNGGGTNKMPILTIDDLSPPPDVNLSLADSVSIKELSSPPNETPGNIAPTLSKVGIIGITIVAAIMFVFALARGKNRYEQQQKQRRRSRGCDGEVATNLEVAAGAAEQEDYENISDLSSVWSADDHAPEQRNLE